MTRHVLIGVGGSGQHVVLAYLRLLALTLPAADAVPHLFVLDADASEARGGGKRSRLIDDIIDLHRELTMGQATPPVFGLIKPYPSNDGSRLLLSNLIGDEESTRRLAQAFLADDEGAWGSDWNVEIDKGMMANPKVGAIALAHKVTEADAKGAEGAGQDLDEVFARLGQKVRVAVVGSSFGGTGSGVIPALLRVLDGKTIDKARAFMTLPWFEIVKKADERAETSAAAARDDVDPQRRNASLGLYSYWDDDRVLKRSSYVICQSMKNWPAAKRPNQGNSDQEEQPHVLNLALANAIQCFFALGEADSAGREGILFSLKSTSDGEAVGQFDARSSPHLRLWGGPDDSRQLFDIVADAEATAMVLERGARVLMAAKEGMLSVRGVADKKEPPSGLLEFVEALRVATGAKVIERGGIMGRWFGAAQTGPEDSVFHDFGKSLLEAADSLRVSLLWVDEHSVATAGANKGQAVGVTSLPAGHLFRLKNPGEFREGSDFIDDETLLKPVWDALSVAPLEGAQAIKQPVNSHAYLNFAHLFMPDGKTGQAAAPLVQSLQRALSNARRETAHDLAARVVATAAHRQTMAMRTARITEGKLDAAQFQPHARGDKVSPMLDLHVSAGPIGDARLAGIDLNANALGEPPGQFNERHKRCLKYLDPYGEAALRRGAPLNFNEASFPEHGLRAIPNAVAPLLLQRWRLQHGLPVTEAEKSEPLLVADGAVKRASKRGIHLHARRINEAAFWLLVKADSRVRYVDDLLADGSGRSGFKKVVVAELRKLGVHQLPALVLADKQAGSAAAKPVLLWGGDTWFLAANLEARRFFARLIAELPSVRYAYVDGAPLTRAERPGPNAGKPLDAIFADEMVKLRQVVRGLDGLPGLVAFGAALDGLLAELPVPAQARATPDPQARHVERTAVCHLPLAEGNPNTSLQVHAPTVLSSLDRLLNLHDDSPPILLSQHSAPGTIHRLGKSTGLLPFSAELWRYLDEDGATLTVRKTAPKPDGGREELARCKVEQLTLHLAGLDALPIERPFKDKALRLVELELGWAFSVWPGFRAPGWKYYVVSGICNGRAVNDDDLKWRNPVEDLSIVVYGRAADDQGPMVPLATIERGLPRRILGVPEVMELRLGSRVLGSRRIRLADTGGEKTLLRIGIDFGTSNTCMAIDTGESANVDQNRRMVPLLPLSLPKDDHWISFSSSDADTEKAKRIFLVETGNFFHARSAVAEPGSAATLPSELLAALHDELTTSKSQRGILGRSYKKADNPISLTDQEVRQQGGLPVSSPFFSPLPNRRIGDVEDSDVIAWIANMVKAGEDRLYGDLKWERVGDTQSLVAKHLRALYLEHVLAAAFAYLRWDGWDSFTEFVLTQPEARTGVLDQFSKSFQQDLDAVLKRVCAVTGMSWVKSDNSQAAFSTRLVSETTAALQMSGMDDEAVPHSALTIDVGGGTTDVGVLLKQGANGPRNTFTASARFAGNQLLGALVNFPEVRASLGAAGEGKNYSNDALVAMLKARLRNDSSVNWFEGSQAVTEMFFDGIFEYALRMLVNFSQATPGWLEQFTKATPEAQRLDIILMGNGFKLFNRLRAAGGGSSDSELIAFLNNRIERAIKAGMLPAALAGRINPKVEANSKNDLIRVGAFNAARFNRTFEPGRTNVLVPRGLIAAPKNQPALRAESASVVAIDDFKLRWLGWKDGGGAGNPIRFELATDDLRRLFPLTCDYWTKVSGNLLDNFRNVFPSYAAVAEQYMDVGALYLTGARGIADAKCFSWLLSERVKQWGA